MVFSRKLLSTPFYSFLRVVPGRYVSLLFPHHLLVIFLPIYFHYFFFLKSILAWPRPSTIVRREIYPCCVVVYVKFVFMFLKSFKQDFG